MSTVLSESLLHSPLARRLGAELDRVEELFSAELQSDLACVRELIQHVERYRGKMLRPMLVLASALSSDPEQQRISEAQRTVAAVVEMIHVATLVHDDVLDEAHVRRRGRTVNGLAGNEMAVMLGDLLFSHAYHLLSSLNRPELNRLLCLAANAVCEGELLQLANRYNWALDEATYFQIIRLKTASLCAAACRVGALLAEAPGGWVEHLTAFGQNLGTAYQIIDDLLDLAGDPEAVGKTLGRDVQQGKLTLPLIHHLNCRRQENASVEPRLLQLLRQAGQQPYQQPLDRLLHQEILKELEETDSLTYASHWARRLADAALAELEHLPAGAGRRFLGEITEAILRRRF